MKQVLISPAPNSQVLEMQREEHVFLAAVIY